MLDLGDFQMPPSYSMMLPGRMSTPLIFMCLTLVDARFGAGSGSWDGAP